LVKNVMKKVSPETLRRIEPKKPPGISVDISMSGSIITMVPASAWTASPGSRVTVSIGEKSPSMV
jgi:hypothetical protein